MTLLLVVLLLLGKRVLPDTAAGDELEARVEDEEIGGEGDGDRKTVDWIVVVKAGARELLEMACKVKS